MSFRKFVEFKLPLIKPAPVEAKPPAPKPAKPPVMPPEDRGLLFRQNNLGGDARRIALFNKFDKPLSVLNFVPDAPPAPPPAPPAPPAVDQSKVEAAVSSIKDSLDQGVFDWDVTHGDLENIQKQFQDLNPAEANAAFGELSDDDLKNWNQELNGLNGSYDKDERRQLFDELGAKLDGANAARMFGAMENENDKRAFAHSVGQHGEPAAKVDFINSQMANVENDPQAALAVAEVIGGMHDNPAELEGILAGMTPAQISAVMKAASCENTTYSPESGIPATSFDTAPLAAMVDAVSGISNAEIKAEVFQTGALEMKRIGDAGGIFNPTIGKNTDSIRDSLTNLLNSDTTGVMENLESSYRNGNGVTAYVKAMIEGGKNAELGQIIAKLAKGNSLTENPMTRFTAETTGSDGKLYNHNAQVLGYFSGAILAAARQITGDTKQQGDILKNIFGTIAGAAGATGTGAGVASSILNGLTSATVDAVVSQINNGTLSMAEGLANLLFPQDPATGKPYNGGTETDYDAAVGRVLDHNPGG